MFKEFVLLATKVAGLLEEKEKNKYIDQILSIEKEIADEELKTTPDDGYIGSLHLKFMRISNVLANTAFAKKA